VLSGAVVAFFLLGYFGVGWVVTDPADARSLALPIDGRIPFLLGSVVVYWSILPMALLPIFVVRDAGTFGRVALAYAFSIAVALAVFVVFPVTAQGFRPDAREYSAAGFAGWLLQLLHFLDPPLNLFPSLHLALAFLAALAAAHVRSGVGALALAWTAVVAVSVCTTKQHFVLDTAAGIALGGIAHRAFVARRGFTARATANFGARGLAYFAALVAMFYAGLYGAYRLGVDPWTWAIG